MNIAQPAQAARTSEAHLSFLQRIFGERKRRARWAPLYAAIVAAGRDPRWYREGGVPDTIDGRFDMVAAVTALVLLRLEALGEEGRGPSILLTELFIDDMDAALRQIGIGDYVVGKHVGRMMGALGGRLAAFRAEDFEAAARRNIFHDSPPSDEALALVAGRLQRLGEALGRTSLEALAEGKLP
ncbi:MAG TPA: ubiquinol-cytochrome C chaperone family protein [Allosphingosinicella sp.]|nr:ubiquinol-cytochrome C chaperone family protein [Allosphingosinicella sp.]